MAGARVLVFDLGGVVVDSVGLAELQRRDPASDADGVRQRWEASPALIRFQTGRSSPEAFAASFVQEWPLDLEPAEFLQQFAAWVKPPAPATLDLLGRLRTRHQVACLSNTNIVHWQQILDGFGLRGVLDRHLASHELGLLKPAPEIYARAERELGCGPQDIVFFDDAPDNVAAARAAGWSAHVIPGLDRLGSTLAGLGYA
jgi:putative hydrolase of the HAD superfamily